MNKTGIVIVAGACTVAIAAGFILRPHTDMFREQHTHESYSYSMPTTQSMPVATSGTNYVLNALPGRLTLTGQTAGLAVTMK